jgi:putative restriction endonuclease
MDTIKNWNEILQNIEILENYSEAAGEEKEFHTSLVKKGTCFIAYQKDGSVHFAPSRFVGYANNEMRLHVANKSKDGRITNPIINKILNESPQINKGLESEYKKFCQSLGFVANNTGSFGVARKFWCSKVPETKDLNTDGTLLISDLKDISNQPDIDETEKERLLSARIGQGWYREGLINYWQKCAITKCDEISLLRASHIKPWRYSNNKERLDIYNGILLSPNLDLLFDKGFITFSKNGSIQISSNISSQNLEKLGIDENMKIVIQKNHLPYLNWHRKNIFRK